jgi:HlyD family secretion protein
MRALWIVAALALIGTGCKNSKPAPLYEKVPVARRDLNVSVSAAGLIEPVLTVDVKSKASGEIVEMHVQTGDDVQVGELLARIDPRLQRNTLAQAEANLGVAHAQLQNAEAQKRRSDELFKSGSIAETEHENANLAYATANAAVVRAQSDLENARDQMEDTSIRATLRGTILTKSAELGTVISSPTKDVGGGTTIFNMANLDTMQVRALVDETDIGKITPGTAATVSVDAYPNRSFTGHVLKIEPQATVQQNVTMFPVLIGLENPGHLLRPGMNTEVELEVGQRQNVLTIPNAALRTARDVSSAAQVLGLDPKQVQEQLAAAKAAADTTKKGPGSEDRTASLAGAGTPKKNTMTLPSGREITLPDGVTPEQVQAIIQKRMSGAEPTPAERALMGRVFGQMGGGRGGRQGGGSGGGPARAAAFGGSYIVFALRQGTPTPVEIQTGLTDLDHIEVARGLSEGDTVLMLPSASLVSAQQEFKDRMQRMQGGGGLPGVRQQDQPRPATGGAGTSGAPRAQAR